MPPASPADVRRLRPAFVGLVMMAAALFVTLASGAALGTPAVVGLAALWVLMLVAAMLLLTRRPWVVLALPLAHLGLWAVLVWA